MSQFKRLNLMKKIRNDNRNKIVNGLVNSSGWKNQYTFFNPIEGLKPSWFGLPLLINRRYSKNKKKFLKYLNKNNIETRPIISGNFLNQPCIKLYNLNGDKKSFKYAQEIEDRDFFIGLHTYRLEKNNLDYLINKLLKVSDFF